METPKEYYYTYYSYEEWGRGYFGSRGCKCLPEEDVKYFGSFYDKTFNPTQKIILKDDYATRVEAIADEIILHDYYDIANNPHFANQAKQTSTKFVVNREVLIERNKKGRGKKMSDEFRQKMSSVTKGEKNGMYGKSMSEKTKQALLKTNLKYLYEIISPEGDVYITGNLGEFCKIHRLDGAAMHRVCWEKQKSHMPKRKERTHSSIGWTVRILEQIS